MAGPDIGFATALRGNTDIVEKLGRMQFQANEAAKNRAVKAGIEEAKQQKKQLEQFDIPTGVFHRLVIPEMEKAQTEVVEKLRKLKEERPNDYGNEIPNLAREYTNKMNFYSTASKDLYAYETQTSSVDKGNTYFSKQQRKFNPIFETATDLTDFYEKLEKNKIYGDASLQFRPNGSVSFTPIPDRKPIRTIEDEIIRAVPLIDFSTKDINKKYGYKTTTTSARAVTNQPGIYGISKAEIARMNPEAAKTAASIEDIVDDWITNSLGNGGVFQYADEQDLPYNLNSDDTLNDDSRQIIKDHIMGWARNYANPKVKSGFVKEPNKFDFGNNEPENSANAVYEPSLISSTVGGKRSFKFGTLDFSFDKDEQSIPVTDKNAFDADFNAAKPTTLSKVKATGVVILGVDESGAPMRYTDIDATNEKSLAGTDVFVRVSSGDGYFYIKYNNYGSITSQFQKKPSEQLQNQIKDMIIKSARMDKDIANKKKKAGYKWADLITLP